MTASVSYSFAIRNAQLYPRHGLQATIIESLATGFTVLTEKKCAEHEIPMFFEVSSFELDLKNQLIGLSGEYRCLGCVTHMQPEKKSTKRSRCKAGVK